MVANDRVRAALTWDVVPELTGPYCVAGFHGWSDAGSVSSDSMEFLIETLKPKVFARISHESFIDLTLERPVGRIEDGIIHELEPLETEVMYWKSPEGDHDLVLLLGKEPHVGWLAYVSIILAIMDRLSCTRLYTVGGVQDTVSHYSPPVVSLVGSSPQVVASTAELAKGIRTGQYHGPVSVHSYLVQACGHAGREGISLWGHVPAYLQKSPRVVAQIVEILSRAAKIDCPVDALKEQATEFDRRIQDALLKDPNLKRLVETIERETPQRPLGGADNVIRLNDFLRRDPHDETNR